MDEWIRDTTDIGSHKHQANTIVKAIARGLRYKNAQCFNCGEFSHLQRNCDQVAKSLRFQNVHVITVRNMILSEHNNEMPGASTVGSPKEYLGFPGFTGALQVLSLDK